MNGDDDDHAPPLPAYTPLRFPIDEAGSGSEPGPDGLPVPVSSRDIFNKLQLARLEAAPTYPLLYPMGPDGDVREGWMVHPLHEWGKDIGTCYLGGLFGGSMLGVGKGLLQSRQRGFGLSWLTFNQVLNNASRVGGNTANTLGVFGFTYTVVRGLAYKYQNDRVDSPLNEAYGAAAAATLQGMSRFGPVAGVACGVAAGCSTFQIMKRTWPMKKAIGL